MRTCVTCKRERSDFTTPRQRRCDECWARWRNTPCEHCGDTVPVSYTGRPRAFCDKRECRSAGHAKAAVSKARRIAARKRKRCPVCTNVKPLTAEYWHRHGKRPDGSVRWHVYCKPCANAEQRVKYAHDERMRTRVIQGAERRRQELRARRAADPAFDAEMRALQREYWRAEKRRQRESPPVPPEPVDREHTPLIPVAPVLPHLEGYIRRARLHVVDADAKYTAGTSTEALAENVGLDARSLSAWRTGERRTAQFDTVERVLMGLGLDWPDVYERSDFPEGLSLAEALFA